MTEEYRNVMRTLFEAQLGLRQLRRDGGALEAIDAAKERIQAINVQLAMLDNPPPPLEPEAPTEELGEITEPEGEVTE